MFLQLLWKLKEHKLILIFISLQSVYSAIKNNTMKKILTVLLITSLIGCRDSKQNSIKNSKFESTSNKTINKNSRIVNGTGGKINGFRI